MRIACRGRRSSLRWWIAGLASLATMACVAVPSAPGAAEAGSCTGTSRPSVDPLVDPAAFANPPVSARPKARWWWPGADVSDAELPIEISSMKEAGFGGAELSFLPLSVFPSSAATSGFGTPELAGHVATALRAARTAGICIDITGGAAWPITTPATTPASGLSEQELAYAAKDVIGPTTYSSAPPSPGGDQAKLVAVTAARPVDQTSTSLSPAVSKPVMLDPTTAVDLTSKVGEDGNLQWDVPEGHWMLFGFWRRPTAQQSFVPEAYPSASYVPDHFSAAATKAVTDYWDQALFPAAVRSQLPGVGGDLFEDSLELVTGNLLWTPDFLQQFRSRRGYALAPYLPALFIANQQSYYSASYGPPDYEFADTVGARARKGYYETLTDLYVDNHLRPLRAYAHDVGLRLRAQPGYGMAGLNTTRSAALPDIAESETLSAGDTPPFPTLPDSSFPAPGSPAARHVLDFYRVLAAGAHAAGIRQVSLEFAAAINRDYQVSHSRLFRMLNRAYVGGVTQAVLHGVAYRQAPGSSWPGWAPFSGQAATNSFNTTELVLLYGLHFSDGWNPLFPEWRHWPALTAYQGRANEVLESGVPRLDFAVYDGDDSLWGASQPAVSMTPRFDGDAAERSGYTYEYLDPVTLASAPGGGTPARLLPDGPGYRALVVDDEGAMPVETADHLVELAREGLPVVLVGESPSRSTGLRDRAGEDERVKQDVAAMLGLANVAQVSGPAQVPDALGKLGVEPDFALSSSDTDALVRPVHRHTATGDYFYLWNEGEQGVDFVASFDAQGAPSVMDLWEGAITPATRYRRAGDRVEMPLHLDPGATTAIAFERGAADALHVTRTDAQRTVLRDGALLLRDTRPGTYEAALSDGSEATVEIPPLPQPVEPKAWHLHVEGSAPSGSDVHDLDLTELKDWREISELEHTSGVGTYSTTVELPDDWSDRGAYLALGDVAGSVRIEVNGELVTRETIPTGDVDLGRLLHPGANTIEIELATTLNNRVAHEARSTGSCCRSHATHSTQAYGLLGPVKAVPYAEEVIARIP